MLHGFFFLLFYSLISFVSGCIVNAKWLRSSNMTYKQYEDMVVRNTMKNRKQREQIETIISTLVVMYMATLSFTLNGASSLGITTQASLDMFNHGSALLSLLAMLVGAIAARKNSQFNLYQRMRNQEPELIN